MSCCMISLNLTSSLFLSFDKHMIIFVLQVVKSEQERYVGSMLLEPRSLFIMTDDAYTTMLHGIAEREDDLVEPGKVFNCTEELANKRLERDTRISITVRNVEKVSKLSVMDMLKK
ncbi:unnamed protein product [Caenorhabditis nigoni]